MTNTLKYILIGGAALVGVAVIGNKVLAEHEAESKPSGLAGLVAAGKNLYVGLKTVSYGDASAATLLPKDTMTQPLATTNAVKPDAMGYRKLRAAIPRQQTATTAQERALLGLR